MARGDNQDPWGGNNPWGKPSGGNNNNDSGGGKGPQKPDFEEAMRKAQNQLRAMFGDGGTANKRGLALAILAVVVLWLASGETGDWLYAGPAQRAAWLAGLVVLGAGTYFAALWAFGFRVRDFVKRA